MIKAQTNSPTQTPTTHTRKILLIIAMIAILATASVAGATYLFPNNQNQNNITPNTNLTTTTPTATDTSHQTANTDSATPETITLGYSYTTGEKMTYNINMITSAFGETINESMTTTQEVIKVQNDLFTIQVTTTGPDQKPTTYNITMDKLGHITDLSNLPEEIQQMYSAFSAIPGFGGYFPKTQANIGENWNIPLNLNISDTTLQGTINYKITNTTTLTTPAGTYSAFGLDITSNNLQIGYGKQDVNLNMTVNYSGHIDLQKDTCRLLQLKLNVSLGLAIFDQTENIIMNMQMQLTQQT